MTKAELVIRLAERHPSLPRDAVERSVDAALAQIAGHLAEGGRVEIRGFGSFFLKSRPRRFARNPRTQKIVAVPAKSVPRFRAAKRLREMVDYSADAA